jgi:hypothetical protein
MKTPLLTDEQCARLERLEKSFSSSRDGLTPWEEEFLGDVLLSFRQFGDRTIISPKQWSIITRILEKIV